MSAYISHGDLHDAIEAHANGKKILDIPFDLGVYLTALAASGVLHATEEVIEPLLNKGGTIQGRAGVKNGVATDDPLDGLKYFERPNGERYYVREWDGKDDVEVVKMLRDAGMSALAYGPPGTGKTAMFEAAFPDLITIIGTGDTTAMDLIGQFVPDENGGYRWVDGPILQAAEEGRPVLIDEIGLIDTKELAVVYSLMDGRGEYNVTSNLARGTVKAKPGFYVVAATNPDAPGVRLSEALTSRFPVHVEVRTDWRLARDLGVWDKIIRVAQHLDGMKGASWTPQMRELLAFRDQEKLFGRRFALANLIAAAPANDRKVVAETIAQIAGEKVAQARI